MKSSLWERQLLHGIWETKPERIVLFCHPGLPWRVVPSSPPIVAVYGDMTHVTAQWAQKEYVYVTLQKGMAINKSVVGGGDRKK